MEGSIFPLQLLGPFQTPELIYCEKERNGYMREWKACSSGKLGKELKIRRFDHIKTSVILQIELLMVQIILRKIFENTVHIE